MSLLRRLARAAGLAIGRTAHWLLNWAENTAQGEEAVAPIDSPPAEPDPGPPPHWLETVRSRAPWLLVGDRFTARKMALRRPVPHSGRPLREMGPEGSRPEPPIPPPVADVYKERDGEKATGEIAGRSRPRPARPRGDDSVRGPVADRSAAGPPVRTAGPDARRVPAPDSALPAQGSEGAGGRVLRAREATPLSRAPSGRPPVKALPVGPRPAPAAIRSAEPSPPAPSAGSSSDLETTRPAGVPSPTPRNPTVPWPDEGRRDRPHHRSPSQAAPADQPGRPAAKFLPTVWEEPRQSRAPRVNHFDGEAGDADGRWPRLPEWGWQPWQTDPIQRQLQEWSRHHRLAAEQAGSSWSVQPS